VLEYTITAGIDPAVMKTLAAGGKQAATGLSLYVGAQWMIGGADFEGVGAFVGFSLDSRVYDALAKRFGQK
jgi:hypothetical protein